MKGQKEMTDNKLLVDVETANETDCALTYDVSTYMIDKDCKILTQHAFVVRDVFNDMRDVVKQAYYANKIPEYIEDLQNHNREMRNFMALRRILLDEMTEYNCKTVVAYNCRFDRNALNNTLRYLTKSRFRWFFPYDTEFMCIWNMACQTICQTEEYKTFAELNNFISNFGRNYRATAETVYAFLTNNPSFSEEHKGLEDVKIENEILKYCLQNYNDFPNGMGIRPWCWQSVKREIDEC